MTVKEHGMQAASRALLMYCVIYTIAAADEYWVLQWLGDIYGIKLAVFAAILQNASWPVQAYFYWKAKKQYALEHKSERVVTMSMLRSYCVLGLLSTFITLTRTMGITSLPATIYAICANTEIVFEAVMTKLILRRKVSNLQLLAVGLVLSGVFVSLYNPTLGSYGDDTHVSQNALVIGVVVSLASRFASSLNTILADRFLGKDAKSRMGVLECSLANSLIPCTVLPFVLLVVPEYKLWHTQLVGSHSNVSRICIALLCFTVTVSKHADRLAKFSIVSMASTMFYAAVDANMKVIAGIGSFIFFQSDVTWPRIVGFGCIFLSLVVMYQDKAHRTVAASKVVTTQPELPSIEVSPVLTVATDSERPLPRAFGRQLTVTDMGRQRTMELSPASSASGSLSKTPLARAGSRVEF
eukprot:GDKI01020120.1.p1 GENE.GDKI01020120.1~~GDKI01020120.1.p1  ORF type:complete len:411 (-),score=28.44 GDKI01020120.1:586-1818(-)